MSRAGGSRADDPGLAQARTRLAWTRTALSFAAIGAVLLKHELAAGFVVLALSVLVWGVGRVAGVPGTSGRRGRLLVIALAVTAVAAVALALALFGPQTTGMHL